MNNTLDPRSTGDADSNTAIGVNASGVGLGRGGEMVKGLTIVGILASVVVVRSFSGARGGRLAW